MRSYRDGEGQFDFRIGGGGAIAEMRDLKAGSPMLSPSFAGEATDRVIQWTWWSDSLTDPVPSGLDPRFNMTQAGNLKGEFADVTKVILSPETCQVDVYANLDFQWNPEHDETMSAKIGSLTRYRLVESGDLLIRRVMLLDHLKHHGADTSFRHLYIEGWTPLLKPKFDSIGYRFDPDGKPLWWESTLNLTPYPSINATRTYGYAAAFRSQESNASTAVGLSFGAKNPCFLRNGACSEDAGRYDLNQMQWDTGIAILPGLTLRSIAAGAVIDYSLFLIPGRQLNAEMVARLERRAEMVPRPRVVSAQDSPSGDLCTIIPNLRSHMQDSGVATEELAPLIP